MDLIVAHLLRNKYEMKKIQFCEISKQIEASFPNEKLSSYADSKTGAGTLYFKYNYKLKNLRDVDEIKKSNKKRREQKEVVEMTSFNETEETSDEFVKLIQMDIDVTTLQNHWRNSSRVRLESFKNLAEGKSFSEIYKVLNRPDGFILVCFFYDEVVIF